jgi:hypothetical protein
MKSRGGYQTDHSLLSLPAAPTRECNSLNAISALILSDLPKLRPFLMSPLNWITEPSSLTLHRGVYGSNIQREIQRLCWMQSGETTWLCVKRYCALPERARIRVSYVHIRVSSAPLLIAFSVSEL